MDFVLYIFQHPSPEIIFYEVESVWYSNTDLVYKNVDITGIIVFILSSVFNMFKGTG